MTERLGRALLELDTDDSKLYGGIDKAERAAKRIGASFAKTGAVITAVVSGPLALFGRSSLESFHTQAKAVAAVDAALKSMGGTAGFTSKQLQDMASQMQAATTFGDEQILGKVTANLLTFGNISGDVFKRAQQSALDLSARLGQDLQSSAVMLGKALNDPIYGVTALTRVGVALTEQQKEQIREMTKAGDVAAAQAIILAELEKQYGGQAAALAQADGGLAQLANQWDDFKEQIGEVVAMVLPSIVEGLKGLVSWLQSIDRDTLKWIVTIGGIAAAVGPVLLVIGGMASAIGGLIPVIAAVGKAIMFLIAGTGPIGLFIAAAALLGAAWFKWGDDIKLALTDAFEWVALMIERIKQAILVPFTEIGNKITGVWKSVTDGARAMYQAVVGQSYVPDMVTGVEHWFGRMAASTSSSAETMRANVEGSMTSQRDTSVSAFGDIFSSFSGFSEDMFRVNKIWGAGQAFVSAMVGAAEALKLPFPANLIAAAKVLATGLGFVSAIKGATPGGGSAAMPARASGSGASAASPAPVQPAARSDRQTTTIVPFNGTLDERKQLRRFADHLNRFRTEGGQLVIA